MSNYTGIWTPRGILELAGLNLPDKMILSHVIGLSKSKGYCSESNSDLGKVFQMDPPNVSRILKRLEDMGTIRKLVIRAKGNERRLYPTINMIIAYYQYDNSPLLSKTQEGHINLIIASYQSDNSLYKEDKKDLKNIPPTPPAVRVENFQPDGFQIGRSPGEKPPVADHPQLPPVWQAVASEITSNDMCRIFANRQIKAYQLEQTYPDFESILNEFIEGKRIQNEKPGWRDGDDIRSNFRDWITRFLPKKQEQLNNQGHAANQPVYSPVFSGRSNGRFQSHGGLKPPGGQPSDDEFGEL
ncbi:hypothetical protein BWI93_02740 [Siphonobacter sp. BAB-5385]|uniref:MarR family transcriptional regulator n=1 Tax=Siphonobacter sp. BAB-5385 TaxID=1864822 RepID=UPI000B9E51CE|nr:MarR family transcriptional regulator [Siphonobacter sp. BAB-5385]OZI09660.1 hypothetical protein BWI93_02740 [Siphonobacter sp. BAB-5385]